jgi:hypothetical protein
MTAQLFWAQKTNKLSLQAMTWNTFGSIEFRFTVEHRPPFMYQMEVFWLQRYILASSKSLQTANSQQEEAGKLFFTLSKQIMAEIGT